MFLYDAINYLFSDTRIPAIKRGLETTDDKDYFSKVIPDIFRVIACELPIKDIKALHVAMPNIRPVTQLLINKDLQQKLEDLLIHRPDLTNPYVKTLKSNEPEILSFIEKAKNLSNYSEEKIQVLRNAITFYLLQNHWFFDGNNIDRRICTLLHFTWENWENFFDIDYKLSTQILIKYEGDRQSFQFYYHADKINALFLMYMKAFADNHLSPKRLEIFNRNEMGFSNEKLYISILKTLQKNQSITEILLAVADWNSSDLNIILETFKTIDRIQRIEIDDMNMASYYSQHAATWRYPAGYSWFQTNQITDIANIMAHHLCPISTNLSRFWNTFTWKR